jgi:hypothetical protein
MSRGFLVQNGPSSYRLRLIDIGFLALGFSFWLGLGEKQEELIIMNSVCLILN